MKQATKSLNLPKPIAAYFNADKRNGEAIAHCFTTRAIVKDEGQTHRGPAAIKAWWYPGERMGYEFMYPRDQALRLALGASQPVLTTQAHTTAAASK